MTRTRDAVRRMHEWHLIALAALLIAVAVWLLGCSSPAPVAPVVQTDVRVQGRTVSWTTSKPTYAVVVWGTHAGRYDHVAYPPAPIADRSATVEHAITLLAAASQDSVYAVVESWNDPADPVVTPLAVRLGSLPATGALLTWTMIDVGFGDSHLLTMPVTHAHVLIDAGERRDAPNVERFLADAGVTRLDEVLMTHAHEDHIGGMVGESWDPNDGVLGVMPVGALIEGPPPSVSRSAYDELVALCASRAIPRRRVASGDDDGSNPALTWDPDVRVRVLHAGGGRALGGDTESEWLNDDSIVLRITYGNVTIAMGGDAESPVESALLAQHAVLDASLLKVHHHGSANASDPGWLDAVHPRVGLIPITTYESTGGTLPSGIVLQRLRDRGVDIYASDRAERLGLQYTGDTGQNVTVVTNGSSYEVAVAPSASRHWPPDVATAAGR
ncbi:MAG TPA: MBL fold metallo-hydrolase [Candidatus Eisenbacteria bacterium]|nr:MBL fold metallo-hydrolase [Candidatus Eisenbacteria bacterium]